MKNIALCSLISSLLLTQTGCVTYNLLANGVEPSNVHVVGDSDKMPIYLPIIFPSTTRPPDNLLSVHQFGLTETNELFIKTENHYFLLKGNKKVVKLFSDHFKESLGEEYRIIKVYISTEKEKLKATIYREGESFSLDAEKVTKLDQSLIVKDKNVIKALEQHIFVELPTVRLTTLQTIGLTPMALVADALIIPVNTIVIIGGMAIAIPYFIIASFIF